MGEGGPPGPALAEDAPIGELLGLPTGADVAIAEEQDQLAEDAECNDDDLPRPTRPLPESVEASLYVFKLQAQFSLGQKIDLQKVSFGYRHAELPSRRRQWLNLRLLQPRVIAHVSSGGHATLHAGRDVGEEALQRAARTIGRIVKKCGHPTVQLHDYRVTGVQAAADMRRAVRLEAVDGRWPERCMYEPEVTGHLHFALKSPKCALDVSSAGKLLIRGGYELRDAAVLRDVLRRAYTIFYDFSA